MSLVRRTSRPGTKGEERALLGFMFSVFMFTFVLIYGMHVMRGVIEEKSNRIVEVVLSIVRLEGAVAEIAGIGLWVDPNLGWAVLSWGLLSLACARPKCVDGRLGPNPRPAPEAGLDHRHGLPVGARVSA